MNDPNRWQPLQLEQMISQNGIPVENGVQQAVGPHWGHVLGFGIPDGGAAGVPIDPGPPPRLGDPATGPGLQGPGRRGHPATAACSTPAVGRRRSTSRPAPVGGNTLGTNDGTGHPVNPATGQPYAAGRSSSVGDFARALTEFWADGPKSETPPGHWNVIANDGRRRARTRDLQDRRAGRRRSTGCSGTSSCTSRSTARSTTPRSRRGASRATTTRVRPISMIRYLGGPRPVERSGAAVLRPGGPAARARPRSSSITPETTAAGPAPRGARRARGRDRHPRLGRQPRRTRRRETSGVALDPRRRPGCRTSCRRSSRRRSRATPRATARSAAPRPRS